VLEEGVVKDPVSGRSISIAALVEKNAYRSGGAGLTVTGSFVPDVDMPDALKQGNISGAYPYAAQVVDLDVDDETGRVTINKIWAAHDLGRAINPVMSEGQVEGGVAMGIGWALMENMVLDEGRLVNDQFLDYVLPGAMDIPDMEVFLVESMEPTGPFGAKSLGEPSIIPIVPAIASAIHEAVGRRRCLPQYAREEPAGEKGGAPVTMRRGECEG
jgi:CO/xanthine dehydrogenase Mo-binding subunit